MKQSKFLNILVSAFFSVVKFVMLKDNIGKLKHLGVYQKVMKILHLF